MTIGSSQARYPHILLVLLIALVWIAQPSRAQHRPLRVAIASNLQFVFQELSTEYERLSKQSIEIVIGASGTLTAQILNGAPYDLFVSADSTYTYQLWNAGLAASRPRPFARGVLVLWTTRQLNGPPALDLLGDKHLTSIAIANPKTAPFGRASVEVLRRLGMFERLEQKIVYGESIAQVNHYIESGAVDIGFTSKSSIIVGPMKNKGLWVEVESKLYSPLGHSVAIVSRSGKQLEAAGDFATFLQSTRAREILKQHGYMVP